MRKNVRPSTSNYVLSKFQTERVVMERPSSCTPKRHGRMKLKVGKVVTNNSVSSFGFDMGNTSRTQPRFQRVRNALPASFQTPVIDQRHSPKRHPYGKGQAAKRAQERISQKWSSQARRAARDKEFLQEMLRRRLGATTANS